MHESLWNWVCFAKLVRWESGAFEIGFVFSFLSYLLCMTVSGIGFVLRNSFWLLAVGCWVCFFILVFCILVPLSGGCLRGVPINAQGCVFRAKNLYFLGGVKS